MATLIDKSYFIADINLPKSDIDNIQEYIDKFEPKVLINLLGYKLYKMMMADQNSDRFKKLIEGSEYEIEYSGKNTLVNWVGLKNTIKESLIAYYVYTYFLKEQVVTVQQNGVLKSRNENSDYANAFGKIMSAWMKFEHLYGSYRNDLITPSAYNFLKKHEADYPEWIFTELKGSINSHDL